MRLLRWSIYIPECDRCLSILLLLFVAACTPNQPGPVIRGAYCFSLADVSKSRMLVDGGVIMVTTDTISGAAEKRLPIGRWIGNADDNFYSTYKFNLLRGMGIGIDSLNMGLNHVKLIYPDSTADDLEFRLATPKSGIEIIYKDVRYNSRKIDYQLIRSPGDSTYLFVLK